MKLQKARHNVEHHMESAAHHAAMTSDYFDVFTSNVDGLVVVAIKALLGRNPLVGEALELLYAIRSELGTEIAPPGTPGHPDYTPTGDTNA